MLRSTVLAVVGAALAATLAVVVLSMTGVLSLPWGAGVWAATQLAIVLAAIVFERVRYKRIERAAPPGFAPTPERFLDPASGVAVQVWFNAATGERRYVAAGPM